MHPFIYSFLNVFLCVNLGIVTTLAGSVQGYLDGTGTNAALNSPQAIWLSRTGSLIISDRSNNVIRQITAIGITTVS